MEAYKEHNGALKQCAVCGSGQFQDVDVSRRDDPFFPWLEKKCCNCEQHYHVRFKGDLISMHMHQWHFASWWLLPPISSMLYKSEIIAVPPLIVETSGCLSELLIKSLANEPKGLYDLHPRRFEELVAELLRDFGYEIVLTPYSKDGGVDILVTHRQLIGTSLTHVHCKRWAQHRPVKANVVQSAYGIMNDQKASNTLIITTSRFTSGAIRFKDRHQWQISLRDYEALVEWLKIYTKTKGSII